MDELRLPKIVYKSGTKDKFLMHIDKIISSIALVLSAISWDQISLITGSILACVMTVYYVIGIIKKLKCKDKDNE